MKLDNVIQLEKPEKITKDLLIEILQKGSQRLLATAEKAELEAHIEHFKNLKITRAIRKLFATDIIQREIQTGIGQIKVKSVPHTEEKIGQA